MSRASTQQTLRQLPTRWALALLGLIVLYAVVQPIANSRLGWKLPSLARLLGEPEPKIKPSDRKETEETSKPKRTTAPPRESTAEDEAATDAPSVANKNAPSKKSADTTDQDAANRDSQGESKRATKPKQESSPTADSSALLYGLLRDTGGKRYLSPAGLQYNPGSEEGHRLKHIERHLEDDPDRPGKHGVFDGDMPQVIAWIDDAYTRGKRGAKGVRKSEEDGRTVYEVPFDQPIGYIGGRDGKRTNHPPAKRMRLVLDGVKVITAFPF